MYIRCIVSNLSRSGVSFLSRSRSRLSRQCRLSKSILSPTKEQGIENTNLGLIQGGDHIYFSSKSSKDKDKDGEKLIGNGTESVTNYDPKEDPFFTQEVAYGKKQNKGQGDPERPYFSPLDPVEEQTIPIQPEQDNSDLDEVLAPPTNCCRSGCPNCVWIEYVEKLSNRYMDPELSRELILKDLEVMEDQSIKAFIKLELRSRGLL